MNELDQVLTKGLKAGYAGGMKPQDVTRGPFTVKQLQPPLGAGELYIDEWTSGGGQEIAEKDGKKVTRVHAGRPIPQEQLEILGITKQDVVGYLIRKNVELAGKTRLGEKCLPEPDGDWQYEYQILDTVPEIGLRIGLESIYYKDSLVFAHGFLQSPIE